MAYVHYDRLSALDATFLALEDENVHMHVGAVAIFDAKPLTARGGGLDLPRLLAHAGPAIGRNQRFRQRLARIPVVGHPVWVDDEHFQLDYHLRHTALPLPGSERQLKRLAGRVLSQKLDLNKPLWELWIVEGLEGDRCALIAKLHHCMVDGISGVDLLALLLDVEPRREPGDEGAPARWLPRPVPGPARLLRDELARRAGLPPALLGAGLRALRAPRAQLGRAREAVDAVQEILRPALRTASPTPLNEPVGPHRRFDWTVFGLDQVKAVKQRLGGTVNDVVLATAAGALRAFLARRGVAVDGLDFRAQVPVDVRPARERGRLGNRVATLVVPLPVHEPDRRRRYEAVLRATHTVEADKQVRGSELLEALGDWTATELLAGLVRTTAKGLAFNLTITNVPGPPMPVYLLDAPMLAIYPVVPLFPRQCLGLAVFSYDGRLFWGFHACWDAVPDLHDAVLAMEAEFAALRALAGAEAAS